MLGYNTLSCGIGKILYVYKVYTSIKNIGLSLEYLRVF